MAERISFNTFMSNIQIRWHTWRHGEKVGTDRYGNTYYRSKRKGTGTRERRWVLFAGEPEASKVPPEWHGWLHYQQAELLPEQSPYHQPWVQEHKPNLTGSEEAYRPPGHELEGGRRQRATGDYEAWTPE